MDNESNDEPDKMEELMDELYKLEEKYEGFVILVFRKDTTIEDIIESFMY